MIKIGISLEERGEHLGNPGYAHNNEQLHVHDEPNFRGMKSFAPWILRIDDFAYLGLHFATLLRGQNEKDHVQRQLNGDRPSEEDQFAIVAPPMVEPTALRAKIGPYRARQVIHHVDYYGQDCDGHGQAPRVQAVQHESLVVILAPGDAAV